MPRARSKAASAGKKKSAAAPAKFKTDASQGSRGKMSAAGNPANELVIITGISGSGKLSALKAFEDLGYYAVDNLPMDLIPPFADLVRSSKEISQAVLVVDVREGMRLDRFPGMLKQIRKMLPTTVIFLEASDDALVRRFSETRRPHPLGKAEGVAQAIRAERKLLDPIRNVADINLDTSKFNVHELRAHILSQFDGDAPGEEGKNLMVSSTSFGYKNGVPTEADLVFDVRFLPNPHFVPEFRKLTGRHPKVAAYVRNFPQTKEFLDKTAELLLFLLPHYVREGKSYLTVAFGCTGGQHRSVFIAEEMKKRLARQGYRVKTSHRDMPR